MVLDISGEQVGGPTSIGLAHVEVAECLNVRRDVERYAVVGTASKDRVAPHVQDPPKVPRLAGMAAAPQKWSAASHDCAEHTAAPRCAAWSPTFCGYSPARRQWWLVELVERAQEPLHLVSLSPAAGENGARHEGVSPRTDLRRDRPAGNRAPWTVARSNRSRRACELTRCRLSHETRRLGPAGDGGAPKRSPSDRSVVMMAEPPTEGATSPIRRPRPACPRRRPRRAGADRMADGRGPVG
jgi:hypothetical protein